MKNTENTKFSNGMLSRSVIFIEKIIVFNGKLQFWQNHESIQVFQWNALPFTDIY